MQIQTRDDDRRSELRIILAFYTTFLPTPLPSAPSCYNIIYVRYLFIASENHFNEGNTHRTDVSFRTFLIIVASVIAEGPKGLEKGLRGRGMIGAAEALGVLNLPQESDKEREIWQEGGVCVQVVKNVTLPLSRGFHARSMILIKPS